MKRFLLVLVLLCVAAEAHAQTPTPVTAASPSPAAGQRRDAVTSMVGGFAYAQPVVAEGGFQIGTSAAGAAKVTFLAKGECYVDPSASLGDGAETIVSCAATGAAAGDTVFGAIATTDDVTDVYIKRATAYADSVQFSIGSYTAAQNPGTLTIRYLVLR